MTVNTELGLHGMGLANSAFAGKSSRTRGPDANHTFIVLLNLIRVKLNLYTVLYTVYTCNYISLTSWK